MTASTLSPKPARSRPIIPLLLGVLCLSLFALLTVGVVQQRLCVDWDNTLKESLHLHAAESPETAGTFAALTTLASQPALLGEFAALMLILLAARRWRWAAIWFLAFGGNVVAKLLKVLVDRDRPAFAYAIPGITESSRSYPSGHATGSMIFFGILVYFVAKTWPKLRLGTVVFAGWFILLIGASRVYLGAHWLSDVLGGWALALGWLLLCIGLAARMAQPKDVTPPAPVSATPPTAAP